jgi:tRNA pseudouridine55 synthase
MDGILNLNKPTGMTSHDVVGKVRKLLGLRRVGHAGTLDPGASGVLPVCVGQATRVAEYLSESGKAYRATLVFGIVTDTYDAEGVVVRETDAGELTRTQIEALLPSFLGKQMQVPPRYSAIKLAGQPAYKRARAGEEITLEARSITIFSLEIVDWQPPALTLDIECSKGTYIRSLAYDLGERSGYGAYLSRLVRTRSGPFVLSGSITLEQLAEAVERGEVQGYLHAAEEALAGAPSLALDAETALRVRHGNAFHAELDEPEQAGVNARKLARVYDQEGHFLAVAAWDEDRRVWHPVKVFAV